MKILLPEKVSYIINELEAHGYEGYAVGGCVRDCLLGRIPSDWDITTSASPQEVKRIFPKTFDTGIEHGTVTVLIDKEGFEVTTYRIDGAYADARHPETVSFTSDLREDLRRRDFTINAMAYNDRTGLVDEFSGVEDLQNDIVRCVGSAEERFEEDALRMMRAVRFCAQLGFSMEEKTAEAIRRLAPNLRRISAERIQTELVKLVVSPHPDWIRMAWELGITAVILPEIDMIMRQPQNSSHHSYSVGEHTLVTLRSIPDDKVLRLTMLLHDLGKPQMARVDENGIIHFRGHAQASAPIAVQILKRLKFDNDTIDQVQRLVKYHSLYPEETPEGVRRSIVLIGEDLFAAYLLVKRADTLGQRPEVQADKLAYIDRIEKLYRDILQRGDCLSLKTLAIKGKDLIDDGMRPGKELGEVLNALLNEVLEFPDRNEWNYLIGRSRELRESFVAYKRG